MAVQMKSLQGYLHITLETSEYNQLSIIHFNDPLRTVHTNKGLFDNKQILDDV